MSALVDGRSNWPDERIDQAFKEVREDVRALAPLTTKVAVLESEFSALSDDVQLMERLSRRMHKRLRYALRELDAVKVEERIETKRSNRAHRWWMRWAGVIQALGATAAGLAGIAALVIAIMAASGGHP